MYDRLVKQFKEQQGITEKLKAEDMMTWVQDMNSIANQAREIVNAEVNKWNSMFESGAMGVPITFMDKYNPEQFIILGLLQSSTEEQAGIPILRTYNDFKEMRQDMSYTGSSGGKANGNPVLAGKSEKGNFLYNEVTKEYVHSVYAKIVIKNKHPEDRKQ